MKSVTSPGSSSKRSSRRWWAAAVVLLLTGAGFLAVGNADRGEPLAGPGATPRVSHPAAVSPAPAPTPAPAQSAVVARSVPVSLRIPAIGVSAPLTKLGLNADKTVQVPTKYGEPGWFRLGPTPGQVGSAVILGHVDDKTGPAVFYRLRFLKPGDKVDVSLANGVVAHFAVKSVAKYTKKAFPAQQVYGSHGFSALQLVTCGGDFDARAGSYLSNIVAYTTLVSTTPASAMAGSAG
jgi:sortase (surface protein transpeptidase)